MSNTFEALGSLDRLKAVVSTTKDIDWDQLDPFWTNEEVRGAIHGLSGRTLDWATHEGQCGPCTLTVVGLIIGIRMERALNEERALASVVRVDE